MYRKFFIIPVILVLILIPLALSCAPPSGGTAQPTATSLLQERVTKLEQTIVAKADAGQFSAHEQRIVAMEGKINTLQSSGAANAYTKAETYTRAEVDAAVAAAVKALKDNQAWITASGSTSTPYGTPTTPVVTSAGGTVTMVTNPASLPQIFSGAAGITCSGTTFTVTPTGYVQPYTMRITNTSTAIQYVRPVITLSTVTSGGYYYGGAYPQLIYFNVSISSGYGMIQGTATSNFCPTPAAIAPCTAAPCATPCTTPLNGYCPIGSFITSSTTNPTGGFPINLSPSNANTQPTPSFSFTPVAPALNGYGEFQMTPGQVMDILITIQIATLQQATLVISNSISARM